jgi:hypothetical protein
MNQQQPATVKPSTQPRQSDLLYQQIREGALRLKRPEETPEGAISRYCETAEGQRLSQRYAAARRGEAPLAKADPELTLSDKVYARITAEADKIRRPNGETLEQALRRFLATKAGAALWDKYMEAQRAQGGAEYDRASTTAPEANCAS